MAQNLSVYELLHVSHYLDDQSLCRLSVCSKEINCVLRPSVNDRYLDSIETGSRFFDTQRMIDVIKVAQRKTLNLSHKLSHEQTSQVIADIMANDSIQTLNLSYNRMDLVDVSSLTDALKINHSLQTLDLSGNMMGDGCIMWLAIAIKVNHSLRALYLNNNWIHNQGLRALATALTINQSLQVLDLGGNELSYEGVQDLALSLIHI